MLKKIVLGVLGAAAAVMLTVLSTASLFSDKLSRPEALKRIMTADEPCREAYAKVLDLQDKRDSAATKASSESEPVCRGAYDALHKINIYVPQAQKDFTNERLKRDTIRSCAQLSKVRADLLALFATGKPDQAKLAALDKELGEADGACQRQFKQLASAL